MWIFLTALCIIMLLTVFSILSKWHISVQYRNNKLKLKIGAFTISPPRRQKKAGGLSLKLLGTDFGELLKNLKQFKRFFNSEKNEIILILQILEKETDIQKLGLGITFGFSNAAATGIANGTLWAVITAAVSFADKYIYIKDKTNIALSPVYTEKCFDASFIFSFKMRPYKMYNVAKRIIRLYEKYNLIKFEYGGV